MNPLEIGWCLICMYRVADQIVEILEKAGVKRIYGIVGDSLNPVTDALRRRKTIEWIHVRHEEVAAFACLTPTGTMPRCWPLPPTSRRAR